MAQGAPGRAGAAVLLLALALALAALCLTPAGARVLKPSAPRMPQLPADSPLAIQAYPTGPLQANCYVLYSKATRRALVIDSGDKAPAVVKFVEKEGLRPAAIVATHAHFDHIFGTGYMKAALVAKGFADVRIHCHEKDMPYWYKNTEVASMFGLGCPADFPRAADEAFTEKTEFDLGDAKVRVMHTPGHSPGSAVLYCEEAKLLVTGDTLFAAGVGRTDLPGGSSAQLAASLKALFARFPGSYAVFPGHGEASVLSEARAMAEMFI